MSPKTVLLLVLMGCYSLEAKSIHRFTSMAAHFGVQDCAASTELCTVPSQRKWVANDSPCEECAHATSTYCYDGLCTAKKCTAPPAPATCAAAAIGAECDGTTKCCNYAEALCDTSATPKRCVAWRALDQTCDYTKANFTCKPGLYCNNMTGPGVCKNYVFRTVDQTCDVSQPLNMTCGTTLYCSNTTGPGTCKNRKNLGEECASQSQCKGESDMMDCVGTPKKCTAYRSVGNGVTPPAADVEWCQYGLFLGTDGKCTNNKECNKDADCDYPTDYPLFGVCNPTDATAGCKSGGKGKCAVLAANCASLVNEYHADISDNADKLTKAACCIDAATSYFPTSVKKGCKAAETPKSGSATSFLATSAVFVALVAGFFAL